MDIQVTTEQIQKRVLFKIPFKNEEQASLVLDILNVDKELKGSEIQRQISVEENVLLVSYEGFHYKKLRVTSNALLKNVLLIIKTFDVFV